MEDQESMKRGLWTEEEDAKILEYVSKYGTGKWTSVPKKAGLRRCGKSCRLRWTNYLRPDLNHESFTSEEEEMIIKLHAAIGSRWSMIAQQLPGRTDNDVKNHWNTKLKKKLANMGIDPVTHKPFSQIFADYGSVGDLPKPGTRVSSLSLKSAIAMKAPKTEPEFTQNDQTLGLLSQLQAINFFKHASSSIPNFQTEGAFPNAAISPSSSSSTCSSVARDPSPAIPFDWNEFLLEEEFLPNPIEHRDCSDEEVRLVGNEETLQEAEVPGYADRVEDDEESFVEALMAKESEMIMEFPEIDLGEEFF